ncbi:MAG TPA: class I SAM-dependent methyltransferase, partial [Bauldia sp.]|nr:class I SAM-dependent methyltransferase [Bauldia sp.]
VLEIGTGCGYQAAVLSHVARDVYSIERIKPLYERAKLNLRPLRVPNIRLHYGDGRVGLPSAAPFDAIVIAAAGLDVPQALLEQLQAHRYARMLEVGAGTGRISIPLLERGAQLVGVDLSRAMLTTAETSIAGAGLAGQITLAHGDATRFDPEALFGRRRFDRVFFSYSLSMIPGWRDALGLALDALEADGRLHLVDFGGQDRLPDAFRAALRAWLARFHVSPRDDLAAVARSLAAVRNRAVRAEPLFRGYAMRVEIGRSGG